MGAAQCAVTISIGFHHRQQFVAVDVFEGLIIVAQVFQTDLGIERAHIRYSF